MDDEFTLPIINNKETKSALALTPSQQGFLFHALTGEGKHHYHEQFVCHFSECVNAALFQWALNTLFKKHDCFRIRFCWDEGDHPYQQVCIDAVPNIYIVDANQHNKKVTFPLGETITLDAPQDDNLDVFVNAFLRADLNNVFDLNTIPVRAYLIQSKTESVFIFSYHHIVMDGWSLSLFIQQLFNLYTRALATASQDDSFILPSSIKPFITEVAKRQKVFQREYWASYLQAMVPTSLEPLLQHQDAHELTDELLGASLEKALPPDVCQKIHTLCGQHRITPATLFYVAWGIVLQRWLYADDVVFGATVSGRNTPIDGIESALGLFINTLPLRVKDDGNSTLLQHLQRMHETLINHYEYEYDALAKIKQVAQQERHQGELFNTLVVIENYPVDAALLAGEAQIGIRSMRVQEQTHYPLTLTIANQRGYRFGIGYATRYLTANMAQAMLTQLCYLVEQIVHNPQRTIASLVNISPEQQTSYLQPYLNGMACRNWDPQSNVVEQFLRVIETAADRVAVADEQDALTYRALAERADRIATYLAQQGIRQGDFVGIISERTVNTVAAIIAIMRIGAAYVPISPDYPSGRMQEMIDDSQLSLLLVQGKPLGELSVAQGDLCALPAASKVEYPAITPDSPAYVIYSSGSTGKPKGIVVAHRSLLRLMQGESALKAATNDVTLLTCPFEFDVSVFEMWSTLLNHGKLVLLSKLALLDMDKIRAAIVKEQVTRAWFTASLFNSYVAEGGDFFGLLQRITVGGEAVSARHVNAVMTTYPHLKVTNGYGPTENTIFTTAYRFDGLQPARVPIGYAVPGTSLYITDRHGHLLPLGATGELVAGGEGVAIGYLNKAQLTAAVFIPDPFIPGGLMYKTGDYARLLDDGCVECFGRKDGQIKISGQRIETGEIEQRLLECAGIVEAVVIPHTVRDTLHLAAVICVDERYEPAETLAQLSGRLPQFAVPESWVVVAEMPKNHSGKVDLTQVRNLLPAQQSPIVPTVEKLTQPGVGQALRQIWQHVLELPHIDGSDSFFALGGTSLDTIRIKGEIKRQLHLDIDITDLFKYPTLDSLTHFLNAAPQSAVAEPEPAVAYSDTPLAIVGMSGRFPGATDIEALWALIAGREAGLTLFSDDELLASGVSPEQLRQSNYIKTKGIIDDHEWFDADFFGYTPNEAELMDPQIRLLHQCCWQTLEHAGCDPVSFAGTIGVFAGLLTSPYWLDAVMKDTTDSTALYKASILNIHAVTALIAHALNLTGPAMTLDTACSTSAVAIHQACNALRNGDCDAALAGGVSIEMPAYRGYEYHEGMINARDGVCRPFDRLASGTVTGDGVATLLLKRLDDALADRDCIYAVIKGSAINNDGNNKVGYTAPSVSGQMTVIRSALRRAHFTTDSIGLVEAHGTATVLGDPIEIRALNEVFGAARAPVCAVSAIKSNIGHLNSAAGVAGVIKTALALHHQELPPTAHFTQLNPAIDLSHSALYINHESQPWTQNQPRRALVSSFGIGGTNASIALEEHLASEKGEPDHVRDDYLLLFSAKTPAALEARVVSTLEYVKYGAGVRLPDVAYTLQTGRTAFKYRRAYLVSRGAKIDLSSATILHAEQVSGQSTATGVCFMFPGQGSQYRGMASALYARQAIFREQMDRCFAAYQRYSSVDLKALLFTADHPQDINQTIFTQPVLFCVEYSLAQTLMALGVTPASMIGHSLGEYVAACIAGVFTLDDAIRIIEARGRLMQSMLPGSMLAIYLSRAQLEPWLAAHEGIELAANNSEHFCVVAGDDEAISGLCARLVQADIQHTLLKTSHAFHSAMMAPMLPEFAALLRQIPLSAPRIPFISNVTGEWITAEQATSPDYWVQQVRNPVLFNEGAAHLLSESSLLVEVGPGKTLSTFIQAHSQYRDQPTVLTLRQAKAQIDDEHFMHHTLATLWVNGVNIDWRRFNHDALGRHIPLPGYPFEQAYYYRYGAALSGYRHPQHPLRRPKEEWLQRVVWQSHIAPSGDDFYAPGALVLVIGADSDRVQNALAQSGVDSVVVPMPVSDEGEVWDNDRIITHFHCVTPLLQQKTYQQLHYLYAPSAQLSLAQSLTGLYRVATWCARQTTPVASLTVLTQGAFRVQEHENPDPALAALSGAITVLAQELYPTDVRMLDLAKTDKLTILTQRVVNDPAQPVMAIRQGVAYLRRYVPTRLLTRLPQQSWCNPGSVVWIIGGEKGIGRVIGHELARRDGVSVILSSRAAHQHAPVQDAGLQVIHCDVTHTEAVNTCLATIIERYGRLDGIIFAAESSTAMTLHQLSESALLDSLAVKGAGTDNVLHALERHQLLDERLLMLFCNSLAAVNAEVGQTGYAAVSAYLDALAEQLRSRYGVNALSVGWDALKEQGMLLEAINGSENAYLRGLRPLAAGSLLQAYKRQGGRASYYARLSPQRDWLLDEHRIAGVATLPGTGYLTLVYDALRHYLAQARVCIDELVFLAPLSVADHHCVDLFVDIEPEGDAFSVEVKSIEDMFTDALTTHAKGRVSLLTENATATLDQASILRSMREMTAEVRGLPGAHFRYGPRWQNLQQVHCNAAMTHAFATLTLPTAYDRDAFALHPALLDVASSFIEQLAGYHTETVPFLYQDLRLYGPMTATLHAELTVNQHDEDGDSYAFTLYDDAGELIARCAALMKRKVQIQMLDANCDTRLRVPCAENYQLQLQPGDAGASTLVLQPTPRLALGDNQVEIEVLASGLNFKDVLFSMGLLRQQPDDAPLQLGLECAGRITRVGKNVREFAPGDDVMAVLNGGFVAYSQVDSHCVVRMPAHCRIEQAAALPIAYLTAYYALVVRGDLQRGERVLIHSAAGGVGLAAVHIAKMCGAEIYATAGSEPKREYLTSLGVHCVADSHSEQFATTLLAHSQGQGMDVILNSLTGRLLDVSLTLLAPLGRFLELGSKDIVEDRALPMRFFAHGGSFIPLNFHAAQGAFRRYLQQIVAWIDDKTLPLLPCKPVPLPEVANAFATLTTPQHIGKVVVIHRSSAGMDRLNAMIAERRRGGYALSMSNPEAMRQLRPLLQTRSPWAQVLISPRNIDELTTGNRVDRDSPADADAVSAQGVMKKRPRPEIGVAYSAPTREVERELCHIIEDYLGIANIGIDDQYAALGATSLDMVQLSGQMARRYPHVSVVTLYNHASVRQLAAFCQPPDEDTVAPLPPSAPQKHSPNQAAKRALQIAENNARKRKNSH
ncbi:TPA: amino acid adenylation domain-containing protein [Serratia marcescens]|uniref:amino acid adenylation domain-containing protein n=1 Tax=Serratia sp. CY47444 TaxID=3383626 RepID=UPI0038C6FE06